MKEEYIEQYTIPYKQTIFSAAIYHITEDLNILKYFRRRSTKTKRPMKMQKKKYVKINNNMAVPRLTKHKYLVSNQTFC